MKYFNIDVNLYLAFETDSDSALMSIARELDNQGIKLMLPSASAESVDGWQEYELNDWAIYDYNNLTMYIDSIEVEDDETVEAWEDRATESLLNCGLREAFDEMAERVINEYPDSALANAFKVEDEGARGIVDDAWDALDNAYDYLDSEELGNCYGLSDILDAISDIKDKVDEIREDLRGYDLYEINSISELSVSVHEVEED